MKILISNDDGIQAEGIAVLAKAFSEAGHEVVVVAPDGQRSAASHSVNMFQALLPRRVELPGAAEAYAVNGTPADCMKLGLRVLCPDADFALSGINKGYNAGVDVLYSGTVAAAMEAVLAGVPAMAVSNSYTRDENYPLAAEEALRAFELLQKHPLPPMTLLNLNYPDAQRAVGTKVAPLCPHFYADHYDSYESGRVGSFYWLAGRGKDERPEGDDDCSWLRKGYVTLTVLQADMTARAATEALKNIF